MFNQPVIANPSYMNETYNDGKRQPPGTITINYQGGEKIIEIKDILFLKANNVFTNIHFANGGKILTDIPLYKYEDMLDPDWFFRVHKSHIINTYYFKEYSSKNGHYAVLKGGEKLLISRLRLNSFIEFLQKRKDNLS
jgi:two-component system LytT family response regulator